MPTSTTAIEVSMMMEAFNRNIEAWRTKFDNIYYSPLLALLQKRLFLQRPYTDDMMQMLTDLGIEPPEVHHINYDAPIFVWQR